MVSEFDTARFIIDFPKYKNVTFPGIPRWTEVSF